MENPNVQRGAQLQDKFELYLVGLVFTVLGLSIQTATFGVLLVADISELLGWLLLLVSGVVGLWRMEYVPVIIKNMATRDKLNRRLDSYREARAKGYTEIYVLEHEKMMSIDELEGSEKTVLDQGVPIIKAQERLHLMKYSIHRYCLVFGISCLVVGRAYGPVVGVIREICGLLNVGGV